MQLAAPHKTHEIKVSQMPPVSNHQDAAVSNRWYSPAIMMARPKMGTSSDRHSQRACAASRQGQTDGEPPENDAVTDRRGNDVRRRGIGDA